MGTPARTPSHLSRVSHPYNAAPAPADPSHLSSGYGAGNGYEGTGIEAFAQTPGNPVEVSPLPQSQQQPRMGRFDEDFDTSQRGSSILDGEPVHRSESRTSTLHQGATPSRSNTLKKKGSLSRKSSIRRSGSRKGLRAGSIKGVPPADSILDPDSFNNVFHTPVPTSGTPTEILANRFQAWRKLLKDIIAYFREVQGSYEHRAKTLLKVSNVVNNTNAPSIFLAEGGINETNRILRDYHRTMVTESNKARDIENEVIAQLSGLRHDLGQKIKEIKSLSGDFKNSVEKEKDITRKAVGALEDALAALDTDPAIAVGKGDPFIVRLGVDRQVEKQIEEENYLHRAYLNLESSGRELESIVVGEIQKAYNALAQILKRDADESYTAVERLREGPLAMPRDHEWIEFVEHDPHFVNPTLPLRRIEDIQYPGRHHPAAADIRAGMLERKSKYLKSYTPGWYVLSPTHLHEFKSADRIYTQPPVMSLYLPEQKLGSHSQPGSSSHKFILKGRQTGAMHRGHSWVFRAETHDTMLAWYEDIKTLTEKSCEERNAFLRRHTRSVSTGSARSVSSDGGLDEDEADEVPYSVSASMTQDVKEPPPQRPSPGGRFPSDIQVRRDLHPPISPSSASSEIDNDITTASGGPQGVLTPSPNSQKLHNAEQFEPYGDSTGQYNPTPSQYQTILAHSTGDAVASNLTTSRHEPERLNEAWPVPPTNPIVLPYSSSEHADPTRVYQPVSQPSPYSLSSAPAVQPAVQPHLQRHNSSYGEWLKPAAEGAATGPLAAEVYREYNQQGNENDIKSPQPDTVSALPPFLVAQLQEPLTQNPQDTASEEPSSLPSSSSTAPTSCLSELTVDGGGSRADLGAIGPCVNTHVGNLAHGQFTGENFPAPTRHDTDISVSDLHVPGQYPRACLG